VQGEVSKAGAVLMLRLQVNETVAEGYLQVELDYRVGRSYAQRRPRPGRSAMNAFHFSLRPHHASSSSSVRPGGVVDDTSHVVDKPDLVVKESIVAGDNDSEDIFQENNAQDSDEEVVRGEVRG